MQVLQRILQNPISRLTGNCNLSVSYCIMLYAAQHSYSLFSIFQSFPCDPLLAALTHPASHCANSPQSRPEHRRHSFKYKSSGLVYVTSFSFSLFFLLFTTFHLFTQVFMGTNLIFSQCNNLLDIGAWIKLLGENKLGLTINQVGRFISFTPFTVVTLN